MMNCEVDLSESITDLQLHKAAVYHELGMQSILQIQKLAATNLYIPTATIDVQNQYYFAKGFIDAVECSGELKFDDVKFYRTQLNEVFSLCNQVIEEFQYMTKRPVLSNIECFCNSSIALAYSFTCQSKDQPQATHGSMSDFGLYSVKNAEDLDVAGMVNLNRIKGEVSRLETFECLKFHHFIIAS